MSHIDKKTLQRLYRGELPLEQQLELLEHLSSCDYCADLFAAAAKEESLLKAPANLKEATLHRAGELPIQLQARQHFLSKRMQLFLYSFKISAAALCSIALLFFTTMDGNTRLTEFTKATQTFTQTVSTVTDQLLNGEVIHND